MTISRSTPGSSTAPAPSLGPLAGYLLAQTFLERFLLFVVPVIVYKKTGSVRYGGLAFLVEWLPVLLALLVSGLIADRWGAATTMRWTNLLRSSTCVAVGAALWLSGGIWLLIIMGGILSILDIFAYICFEKHVSTQDSKHVTKAYSFFQFNQYGMQVLAPIFGSWAVGHYRSNTMMLGAAIAYGLLFLMSGRLPFEDRRSAAVAGRRLALIRESVPVVWRNVRLSSLCLLLFGVNFVYGTQYSALPALMIGHSGKAIEIGGVFAVAALVSLLYYLFGGWIHRHGLIAPLGMAAAVSTSTAPLLLLISGTTSMVAAAYVLSAGPMIAFAVWARMVRNTSLPAENYALTISLMMIASTAAFPLAGGYVAVVPGYVSTTTALAFASMFSTVLSVVGLVHIRQAVPAESRGAAPAEPGPARPRGRVLRYARAPRRVLRRWARHADGG
jgi:hypothetical protein